MVREAGQNLPVRQSCGVAREGQKDPLRHVFGKLLVSNQPQGNGIHEIRVPTHDFRKS
jgi:hypothetical protein